MAAYAALLSLMNLIHDIQNHHSPPISLDTQQLQSLTENATFLLGFLESYTSPLADVDDEADPLEIRIADAAYAAEDVIESYIVDLIKLSRSTRGEETKSTSGEENEDSVNENEDSGEEHDNSGEVNDVIGEEVKCREELSCINKVAVKIDAEKVPTSSSSSSSSAASFLSSSLSSSAASSSTSIVCSDDVLHGIMEKLVSGGERHAIPITGMGGIGKTTLARNLYAKPLIKEYFDVCVWATISQKYNTKQILCELFSLKEDQCGISVDELGLELHQYLFRRRFLIVLDDMWSIDAWDEIQCYFPDNGNGSRILVTTRLTQLGSQLNKNYSLQMPFLDKVRSWDLFSKTVFGKETCPLELVGIGKKIVENCRGLPLSIVVVGGLLKKMEHTPRCWESIRNNLTSVNENEDSVNENEDSGEEHDNSGEVNDVIGEEVKCREELSCINLYEDLHQVIEEMDLINKVAVKIDAGKVPTSSSSSSSSLSSSAASFLSSSSSTSMVCSDDFLNGIMEKLVAGGERHAIPITGMGGIGKTTLARTLYAHPYIKEYFDICVWATISQKYNAKQILCELLSRKGDQSGSRVDELGLELHKYLFRRRFLIVLDDMWSIDAWDDIQRYFPDNGNGSRILVTTRLSQLGSQLNNNYSLQMPFLDEVSSWDLLSKTVFGEEICPHELVGIGKKIAENCRGLPLSIVVVGGLLKKMKHAPRCWESIRNNLTSVVSLENDKHCLRLLKMSYDHLPLYLKPCFLCIGVFEEDYKIRASRLMRLWISEGFLKPINGQSLKTIARGFLEELVDRNLILIDEMGRTGSIKYCKIHDLVRDLCLRESKKYGFYDVIGGEGIPQGINSQRRVFIFRGTSEEEVRDALQSISRTRSVICENKEIPLCGNFGLVRTIDISEYWNPQRNLNGHVFESCVNLRHLVGGVGSMSLLLSSLNVFWNLQTLIVSCWGEFNIAPIGIWKMRQLRHIEFLGIWHVCVSDPPPSEGKDDVVVMENLEILEGVENLKFGEEVVKRIPNVKKLKIRLDGGDDDIYCVGNIKYLCKLESLNVGVNFPCLHKLTFPHSLKTLTLDMNSKCEWEKMLERIGSLPLLQKLTLYRGWFKRGKWEIGEDQFPCLKYLSLHWCKGLKEWTMAQESSSIFPRLEYLHLWGLQELKEIPREIGDIPTLQIIELGRCSSSVVRSAKEIVEEQMEYQGEHLPFHVKASVKYSEYAALQSLAGPNFVVNSS